MVFNLEGNDPQPFKCMILPHHHQDKISISPPAIIFDLSTILFKFITFSFMDFCLLLGICCFHLWNLSHVLTLSLLYNVPPYFFYIYYFILATIVH